MFDLGMQELIVIFVVALIVFGPKRLPELARAIGKGVAEIRRSMAGLKEQIDEEMREVGESVPGEIRDLKIDTLVDEGGDMERQGDDSRAGSEQGSGERGDGIDV